MAPIQGIWAGTEKGKRAKVTEWMDHDGIPTSVLSPVVDSDVFSALGKKKGESVEVRIQRVARDPDSKGGWIVARTEIGLDIPVELSEMSLSPLGYGLERIEGHTLDLTIKDFDETNHAQLTNIDEVIKDLRDIRQQASIGGGDEEQDTDRKGFNLKGYIAEVNEDEDRVVVAVPRASGVVHQFEIYKDYVPMKQLSNLRIGEGVNIRILARDGRDKIYANLLEKREIDNIPKGWDYDPTEGEVFVPYCLGDHDFTNWPARTGVIDLFKRHSWQYCFSAKIVSLKERLSCLNPGDSIPGTIQKIDYDTDGTTIKSVQVILEEDIPGFALGKEVEPTEGVLSEGTKLIFNVKKVDSESGFLKLVSRQVVQERQRKHKEWLARQQGHIERWSSTIQKNDSVIIPKIEKDIERCQVMKRNARSPEFADTVQGWIEEKSQKIRDIKETNRRLKEKINSAKGKMQN